MIGRLLERLRTRPCLCGHGCGLRCDPHDDRDGALHHDCPMWNESIIKPQPAHGKAKHAAREMA